MLTRLLIKNQSSEFQTLALAPLSVLPEYQQKGIGTQLIEKSHAIAAGLGYKSVILLGHPEYYPRFGYKPSVQFGIDSPFDVPPENFMVKELIAGGLKGVSGKVVYPAAFNEHE